jgi:hypothetical protein
MDADPNPGKMAPGYVVSLKNGLTLGLPQNVAQGVGVGPGLAVGLTPFLNQSPATPSTVSQYASTATTKEWATPPILMKVTNNGTTSSYHGTMKVDRDCLRGGDLP